jgi:hypothetical protein
MIAAGGTLNVNGNAVRTAGAITMGNGVLNFNSVSLHSLLLLDFCV